uniref:Cilia- and flagella-associated protein 418 n=1 Tax=Scophthalmus maximus TaxID=52904 RepID=A0A8D3DMY8_SCOMX
MFFVLSKSSAAKRAEPLGSDTEDIDAFLEELLEGDGGEASSREFPLVLLIVCPVSRCCPVFVGGSSVINGVGTATSKSRCCDQLRCVSCDFRVLMFDDCAWDSSCDYLFLRNNAPDRQKLRAKLKTRRGSRAYACQCCWFSSSSSKPTDLQAQPQLRWVCGKHQD